MQLDLTLFSFGYVLGLQGISLSEHPSAKAGYERARLELEGRASEVGRPSGARHPGAATRTWGNRLELGEG